jgi:putative DNA primase/helicase
MTTSIFDRAREACERAGIEYKSVPLDGEWHSADLADDPRGRGDGRIKLFPDGQGGIVWNHKTGEKQNFFLDRQSAKPISPAERARIKAEQERRKLEREYRQSHAARRARKIWKAAKPAPVEHPYLARKHIYPHGARVTTWERLYQNESGERHKLTIDNTLILPLLNQSGRIRNLQAIFPTESLELGRGKDFLPFGETAGLFWWIGSEKTDPVLIAEGFATAATLHEETGYRVYIAFTAGNLLAVGRIVRKHLPAVKIIFAADNDKTPGNPGLTKANEAALAVDGFVACPPIAGDFNDYTLSLQDAQP